MKPAAGFILFLSFLFTGCLHRPEPPPVPMPGEAPFLSGDLAAVDASIQSMTLEEKLGQFIILSGKGEPAAELYQWVKAGKAGGLQWQGLPLEQFIRLRDTLQGLSPQPLFFAAPAGGLLNNAFSDALPLPSWDALQAVPSDTLRGALGEILIQQASALKINYLPSPNINRWEQRNRQLELPLEESVRAINALNQRHILSLAESFSAAHLIRSDTAAVDSMFEVFRHLARAGLSGFRLDAALFSDPGIDPGQVERFFRESLQFGGLLVAEMQDPAHLDEMLKAGIDLIIVPSNPTFVLDYLKASFRKGGLSERELNSRLRRILLARRWVSLAPVERPEGHGQMAALPASMGFAGASGDSMGPPHAAGQGLASYFQDSRWRYWQRRLYEESLVLASNPGSILPLREVAGQRFHILHLGADDGRYFDEAFGRYAPYESRSALFDLRMEDSIKNSLQFVLLHGISLDSAMAGALLQAARQSGLVLVNFGRPDNLALLDTSLAVIQAFSDDEQAQSLAAQLIFGGVPARGSLPFGLNDSFRKGQGLHTQQSRLRFGIPEQEGIAPEKLVYIDAIIGTAIGQHAFPGCQVLVAKGGTVVYEKAFGYHTYDTLQPVRPGALYDLASLTKVAATTLVAMKYYEEGRFGVNDKLRYHLELSRKSRLKNLTIRKLMSHQSGLQPHLPVIPYLLERGENNAQCSRYFCTEPRGHFSIQVAEDFYFDQRYWSKIWTDVERLTPRARRFRYSDVNLALMQRLLERKGGAGLDSLAYRGFYAPLGLRRTLFNPLSHFPPDEIAPTENDIRWRHQLVHGYVHDETAALAGGVAGHAGLFSNTEDLAVIFQMLLNGGWYGGIQYLRPESIDFFTSARHGNHRGLGFDKPSEEAFESGLFPARMSYASYGHTGFTGTCAWADPETGLSFIFLSNRIYPDAGNRKIFDKRVRERVHQAIYDALDTYEPALPELTGVY